jgi:2-amino-4-hydroxy-6-hydroxymethyldihydropteridine diphosphokinase
MSDDVLDAEVLILGLGGNMGGDDAVVACFARIAHALEAWSTVRASPVYRTAAVGPEQADYLNAALAVETPDGLAASELIREVMALERAAGRDRTGEPRWGPRPIDVDVLLWGDRRLQFRGPPPLELPHPQLAARAFALVPAIDLVGPQVRLPPAGPTLGALRAAVAEQRVVPTGYAIEGAVMVAPSPDPAAS